MTRANLLVLVLISLGSQALAAPVRYRFEYNVKLDLPNPEAKLRLWIPAPKDRHFQRVKHTEVKSPIPWRISEDKRYKNRLLYFEGVSEKISIEVNASFEVIRDEAAIIPPKDIKTGTVDDPDAYLQEDAKVPFASIIKEIARKETRVQQSDDEKIYSLYKYVVNTMTYDKSGTGWGNGDAIWACGSKRGNCTDFHSLFIALSRVSGIPARFYIGFPIPQDAESGTIAGYHCWAEAYSKKRGWIPLDTTEAKKTGRHNDFYGELPANRIEFSLGRDLVLSPPQSGEPLNYFIYPYAEVNGKKFETIKKEFSFKRL